MSLMEHTNVGTPGAMTRNLNRSSWMPHDLTKAMSAEGFQRSLRVEIGGLNPVGDTLYINGDVTWTFRARDA